MIHSMEAEEATLGALLIDPAALSRIQGGLAEGDFYRPDHRLIYGAIISLAQDRKAHDVVTVCHELRRRGKEDEAGGLAYLAKLARETPASANIEQYANIVRDRAIARGGVEFANSLSASLLKCERPVADLLVEAEKHVAWLKSNCSHSGVVQHRLTSIEIREFLARKIPPRDHVLSPIIPTQGLTMIYGSRGLGKTQVSVGVAVAVAAGHKFLKWKAPTPAGVLLIDGEMPAAVMQARLAAAIEANDKELVASLHLCSPDLNSEVGMPDLSTLEGQMAVDALVKEDTKLLIIDNLSSLMRTGAENDAESWLPLQTWALRHRAAGRSILFIHHAGKGGAQRGTSRREDVLDCVIALRRPGDYRQSEGARFEVHIEKGRSLFGGDAEPFEARLQADAGFPR